MTFKQIYNKTKNVLMDATAVDRTYWINKGVKKLEELMNKDAYNEVIAQATSKALIYKFNHKRKMPKKMQQEMVLQLLLEFGLAPTPSVEK